MAAAPVAIRGVRLQREAALKEEQVDEYRPGGYRRIRIGDILNSGRYQVVRKLGFGHFSTVWLVKDERRNKHVALKVVKSMYKYTQTAIDEISLLRHIQHRNRGGLAHPGRRHIVEFLDCFALHPSQDLNLGPMGLDRADPSPRHICMTFEPLGETLLTLLKRIATEDDTKLKIGVPTVLVQQVVKQMLLALDFLHENCGLIHTDLKLENVIVCVEDVEELVCACRAEEQMTGVSPTNATRSLSMRGPPASNIDKRFAHLPPGGGDWHNNDKRDREVTITGSSPLPSPMHAWGRVNVGPEVNNLALIMAQMALQRKVSSSSSGVSESSDSQQSQEEDEPTDYFGSAAVSASEPQQVEQPRRHASRQTQTPIQTMQNWASSSGASSIASTHSTGTIFSMSGVSTAPTSMESSLILGTPSSPVVKQSAGSPAPLFTNFSFSSDDDDERDDASGSAVRLDDALVLKKKKRFSSQSDLTLTQSDDGTSAAPLPSPSLLLSPSVSSTADATPTPTLLSAQQPQHALHPSLLSTKKPSSPTSPTTTTSLPSPSSSTTTPRGRQLIDHASTHLPSSLLKPQPPRIRIKIADLGNATPRSSHFTPDIQTRPYRAPEVILGYKDWDESVDVWSVGCMVFELLTSDLLFAAEEKVGHYTRDDDQLAQMIELLGDFPWSRKFGGERGRQFFTSQGHLRRVAPSKLRPWSLRAVLIQKYDYPAEQADKLCDFVLPMLALDPDERPSAAELAEHPWLDDPKAAPPYMAGRAATGAGDDFVQVDDARLTQVLQALKAVSVQDTA